MAVVVMAMCNEEVSRRGGENQSASKKKKWLRMSMSESNRRIEENEESSWLSKTRKKISTAAAENYQRID
jgi:hypothetical protein